MAKSRFESYYGAYKKTKLASKGTGFGVTDEDKLKGITTVEEKLESLCPFFSSMDELFGSKPNVNPANVSESAVLSDDCLSGNGSDHGSLASNSADTIGNTDFPDTSMENTASSDHDNDEKESTSSAPLSAPAKAHKVIRIPESKTPKRKDFSSTYMEAQESLRELKRQAMEAERERAVKELRLREQELRIKEQEANLIKEQTSLKLKEETRRMIMQSLIAQGMKAAEIKEFLDQMGLQI